MSAPKLPEGLELVCAVEPHDKLAVGQATLGGVLTGNLAVGMAASGMSGNVHITPADARRLAARLLDFADHAEGRVALVFMPACPTCDAQEPAPRQQ